MLKVTIPETELFDGKDQFILVKEQKLQLEHSLVSISKWESKWHKPFLSREKKTNEEFLDYVRCMTLTQNVDPNVYNAIPQRIINDISKYIDEPMTATTVTKDGLGNREIITAEIVYYWMISFSIPFECQKWHFNRLMMLINVCALKSQKPKKLKGQKLYSENRALNAARRRRHHTRG